MNENKCLIALTVNPLLSHPGGLFIQGTFGGWLIREGRLNREGWLIDLAKCNTIGIYDITLFKHRNLRIKLKCYNYIIFPYKMVCTWFIPTAIKVTLPRFKSID